MKDPILLSLIGIAEAEEPLEQDITLVVGGFLLSGFVTSSKNFMKHHSMSSAISTIWEKLTESKSEGSNLADDLPEFIHLRDAKFYFPGAKPIPGNMSIFVRISLTSIHGFSFGKLEAL